MVQEGKLQSAGESVPAIVRWYLENGVTGRGFAGDEAMPHWGLGKFVGTKHWCSLTVHPFGKLRFRFTNGVNADGGFTVEAYREQEHADTHVQIYKGVRGEQLAAFVEALANPSPDVEICQTAA